MFKKRMCIILIIIFQSCSNSNSTNEHLGNDSERENEVVEFSSLETEKTPVQTNITGIWEMVDSKQIDLFTANLYPATDARHLQITDSTISFDKIKFPYDRINENEIKIWFMSDFSGNRKIERSNDSLTIIDEFKYLADGEVSATYILKTDN